MARTMGMKPGFAVDLTQVDPDDNMPWGFNAAEKRRKAEKLVDETEPFMLIVSPQCGPFQ